MLIRTMIAFFITVFFDYTLIVLGGSSLHGFIVFIVVPGGALLLGVAFGVAVYSNHLKTLKPVHNKRTIMMGAFLALMIIPAVLVFQFATARLNSDGQIYYSFSGDHISNYSYEDKPIDFFNFIRLLENTSTTTLSFKGHSTSIELEPNPLRNRLFTMYEMAACALATCFVLRYLFRDTKFCASCQTYYEGEFIADVPMTEWVTEREAIQNCIKNGVPYLPKKMTVNKTDYYHVYLGYCPDCKKGELEIDYVRKDEKGKFHSDPNKFRQPVPNAEGFLTTKKR